MTEKPDPLAVAYKQGWTAARNEWKPRAEKAEADAAIGWNEASVDATGRREAEAEVAQLRTTLADIRTVWTFWVNHGMREVRQFHNFLGEAGLADHQDNP